MKLCLTIIFFVLFSITCFVYAQKADHVVIAEVYGGGGNSGAYYDEDYIILYNPTSTSVDLSSWSVQYAPSTSSNWLTTTLSGTISAGSYYAIGEHEGSSGNSLPFTPDVTDSHSLATSDGKVALADNVTAFSTNDPQTDDNSAHLIDFVGYGGANSYEGSAAAPSPSNTESIRRLDNRGNQTYGTNGSGWDTNDNGNDFYIATPDNSNPPLPVELSTFTAKANKLGVQLNWSTATEVNNYGFNVERRPETGNGNAAESWVKVGFVKGNGNSNSPKSYSFVDNNPLTGTVEYRLKQIDNDGSFEYSNKVEIKFNSPRQYHLSDNYPNPFNPVTTIKYSVAKKSLVSLKVYDILGRKVKTLEKNKLNPGKYTIRFHSGDLASGLYIYKLSAKPVNGGKTFTSAKEMVLLK
jgi:hypothetical protein